MPKLPSERNWDHADDNAPFIPTPEQIQEACELIPAGWEGRLKAQAEPPPDPWLPRLMEADKRWKGHYL